MATEYWTAAGLQERSLHPVSRESVAPVLLVETPGSLEPQPAPRKARVSVLLDGPHRRSLFQRLLRWLRG